MPARKSIRKHEPLNDQSNLMSEEKRKWCAQPWRKTGMEQPRIAVFQTAMNTTPRPTNPKESIACGYMKLNKFHDRESGEIWKAIEKLNPHFFDTYPRRSGTKLTETFIRAVIGEIAQAFYRHGVAAYGKPKLRKNSNAPLAAI